MIYEISSPNSVNWTMDLSLLAEQINAFFFLSISNSEGTKTM